MTRCVNIKIICMSCLESLLVFLGYWENKLGPKNKFMFIIQNRNKYVRIGNCFHYMMSFKLLVSLIKINNRACTISYSPFSG